MHLQAGALLKNGEYKIEKVLGQGGFGITYLAEQTSLGRKVALKEFFMEGLCNRDAATSHVSVPSVGSKKLVERFKQKFIKEARMIASFDNNHIISIYDVFEENGTAYYVMEYLVGKSLSAIVNEQGIMSETLAMKYIRQVADALAEVHANNLLHLDVKPANIMLNKKGEAVLIDFGISKHYDEAGNQTSSALIGTSEGYAPLEQYEAGALDSFTPATDIYALGATLFFLLTGTRPPKASEVMNYGLPELPSGVSASVRSTIETAMQPAIAKRPQSIAEFLCLVENGNVKGENGKLKDESDGETELSGNVKGASKREGENLFTHTASESCFDEVKGENGKLVADEFHSIDVVEVPDSEDGNVISNESEKSQSADAVILNASEKSHSANNEILPPFSRQNDKDGNEEVERRNEKEHSAGAVILNESEKSQKNKPGKSLWLILLLLLLIAVAGAWFLFSGTGSGDAPKADTVKNDTQTPPVGEEQEEPVEKGDSVQTPEPIVPMCRLTLTQIPDGAEVYINDSLISKTPIKNHEIPQGTYNIKITKEGYKDYEETFTLDGKERTISPTLEKSTTALYVTTTPSDAQVFIDNKFIDRTPIKGYEIPQGTHNIRITKDGYKDYEETFTLDGKERTISSTLEKSTTALYVTTTPSGAQVFIDNKFIDRTPIKGYEIPQGTYNIKITKDGYKDYNEKIEASAGSYVINETLEEKPKPVASQTTGTLNGHDWVDLGLPSGLKWATCNVGASSPSDYGDHYAWGEISTKSSYDENNSTTYEKKIGDIAGNPTYDVARAEWRGSWRLPTRADFQELLSNCTWEWTTHDGHEGYKVTSKKNGNSIFLPAAGWRFGTSSHYQGSCGYYWSATLDESDTYNSRTLYFYEDLRGTHWSTRSLGHSVRPVFLNN